MRGSIRKWLVVGTVASASLLFPACADTNQGADTATQEQMGTGGAGSMGMEGQEGLGGSGTSGTETHKGTHGAKGGGTMARDAGTPGPTGAGTGGAGMDVDDAPGDVPKK
ncbi:hypothetical protein [Archangium violaceum]|uniref:Lipoprotein n=1 Tax=Archangium violaceum Cb vi76 TaxID=1406225 RepID=A0A084SFD2_9BACT|nr:hypothetical protein [Archangium violaceum]KFA87167.1 hypothetical protein Q664_49435 [Archangium violaceum Cb vi76]